MWKVRNSGFIMLALSWLTLRLWALLASVTIGQKKGFVWPHLPSGCWRGAILLPASLQHHGVHSLQSCRTLNTSVFCSFVAPAVSISLSFVLLLVGCVPYVSVFLFCFISPVTPMFLRSQIPALLGLLLEKYVLIFIYFPVVAAEPWC